jgi:hypothetical protein
MAVQTQTANASGDFDEDLPVNETTQRGRGYAVNSGGRGLSFNVASGRNLRSHHFRPIDHGTQMFEMPRRGHSQADEHSDFDDMGNDDSGWQAFRRTLNLSAIHVLTVTGRSIMEHRCSRRHDVAIP